jgi:ribosomal protein S12 methylthiotransferase accessory factor
MDAVVGSVDGTIRFYGLTPTSMKLEGLDRHHRLIDSYRKIHEVRAKMLIVANWELGIDKASKTN